MTTNAKGLLLVMMDIDPEHEEEFNRWYNEEHVPERLSIPGFLTGRRFLAIEGSPKYLALYELESPEVLESEEYKHFLTKGRSEWTERIRQHFKMTRNVYVELMVEKS